MAGCKLEKVAKEAVGEAANEAGKPVMTSELPALNGKGPNVALLENGLTVVTLEDNRFPLASVRLYVHAGSAYEDPREAGISHLLEHMVFKGTQKRGPGEIAAEVEGAGGSLNAATSFDYTMYYTDVPSDKWTLGMDVVHDMVFGATIDQKELDSERLVVLSELERGEDNPQSRLFKQLQGMIWPDTTYSWPIIGYRKTVEDITRKNILDYIDRMYQPQRMLLVVVGDVKQEDILAEADRLFGNLRNDRVVAPPKPNPVVSTGGPRVEVLTGEWNKVYLGAAFPAPSLHGGDVPALDVATYIMGGDNTSRLYRKYKYEKQLVDSIGLFSMNLERGGMIYVSAVLDADKVETFWKELIADFSKLDEITFTSEELERAKLNLEDSLFSSKETISGLASKLGWYQFFENGQEAEGRYLSALRALDSKTAVRSLTDYMRPESLSVTMMVPEEGELNAAELGKQLELQTRSAWKEKDNGSKKKMTVDNGQAEYIDLANGSGLMLLPDNTLPYVATSIVWRGGDGLLEKDQQGLADFSSRLMSRGIGNRNVVQTREYLSDRASSMIASAGRESYSVSAKFPSRFSADILGLMEEMITKPVWSEEEAARVRLEQTASLKQREDQPLGYAFRELFPFLFSSAGYGYYHLGTAEGIAEFNGKKAAAYWETQKVQPFVMSVCGEFNRETVVTLARRFADSLGKTDTPFPFTAADWKTDKEKILTLPGRNQAHLLRIFPVPGKDDPDTPGLMLLRDMLSGQSGLLFRDLRDTHGLGYTVTAFLWQAPHTGLMAFYIGTEPERVDEAGQGFDRVIEQITTEPLPENELVRAKNLMQGDYYRDHQTLMSRSREASMLLAKGLPEGWSREAIVQARTITPEQVQQLVRKYLVPEKAYTLIVKP